MITLSYVRTMAAYNSAMNRALYGAAARLPDAERRADRGAFWRSIHGTLAHLVWGDSIWMSRFDSWPKPGVSLADSAGDDIPFEKLATRRTEIDAGIEAWATRLDPSWLESDQTWFSGASGREMRKSRGFLVVHFFNHQTHHRGQAHALLTACGEATGDTDLIFLLDAPL